MPPATYFNTLNLTVSSTLHCIFSPSAMANDAIFLAAGFRRSLWIIPLFLVLLRCVHSANAFHSEILLPSEHEDDDTMPHLSASCPATNPDLYYGPVIGILTHPGDGASGRLSNATNASYIAASYVKFVESGGARVIPLIYNEPTETLLKKLDLVNGVLFTGGWAKAGLYYEVAEKILKKALEKNDGGDHFPVFAIALGFELLSMIISEDRNILEKFSGANQASSLQFTNRNVRGTLFGRFPPDLLNKLSTECLVNQNHRYGISPERLEGNEKLSRFFEILTTSTDEEDKPYVSTVRSRDYPLTAVQWNPQKNAFEWGSSKIPHTEDAIRVTQHAANFFVSESRKSSNRPDAQEVRDNLIYNFPTTYGGKAGKGYDQVYIFA